MAWGAVISGALSALGSIGSQGLGSLLASGGTSANDQVDMWERMYGPIDSLGGLSRSQVQGAIDNKIYQNSLASSAQANLDYNEALNLHYPSWLRTGLSAAGYNPILGVLGNYSGTSGSVSAPGGHGVDIGQVTRPSRGFSSAVSADSLYKIIRGAYDSEIEQRAADTSLKQTQVSDVESSAKLKDAEADYVRARAASEVATLPHKVKDLERTAEYGRGVVGDAQRLTKNFTSYVSDFLGSLLEKNSNSAFSVDPKEIKPSVGPSPSTAKDIDELETQRRKDNALKISLDRRRESLSKYPWFLSPAVRFGQHVYDLYKRSTGK